jgi:HEAT repeat protein
MGKKAFVRGAVTRGATMNAEMRESASHGDELLDFVAQDDAEAVARAATQLGMRGDDHAVDALVALLRRADASVRTAAATALGLIGSERGLAHLRTASSDADPRVAQAASIALTRIGDERASADASAVIRAHLHDGDPEQRALAARALGALGDADSCDALCDAMGDTMDEVRVDAARALGQIGDHRAEAALTWAAFKDRCEDVRSAAMASLARLVTLRA